MGQPLDNRIDTEFLTFAAVALGVQLFLLLIIFGLG